LSQRFTKGQAAIVDSNSTGEEERMMTMLEFDADAARRVEAVYSTEDVIRQRRRVLQLLDVRTGEAVLDIGVGPGFLAAEIAEIAGAAGRVCGIDVSDAMLAVARNRVTRPGSATVELRRGAAEQIPYEDASFDRVVSTQVLEYVHDIQAALAQIRRVLRPGGRVLLLDTDWDSIVWHSLDDARMQRVLLAWEQHLADPHLPRTLLASLSHAGFDVQVPEVLPLLNVGFAEDTYSGGLLGIVAEFVVGREGLSEAEVEAWRSDLRDLGAAYFFSINRYVFCATKPA
jgi:ubiquinone/menaquinone biosynthesis C-methylase UbiE